MFCSTYNFFPPSRLFAKLSATFGVVVLALCLAFLWYQWKMIRLYRGFPSKRLDTRWLLPIILGWYPKAAPFTNFVFQLILNAVNSCRKEGLCVVWFVKPYLLVYNHELIKNLVNEVDLADKGTSYDVNDLIFGDGLLGSKHGVWKVHRKLLNPAFNLSVLKGKMFSLNRHALHFVQKLEKLEGKPASDVFPLLKHSAFRNMADYVLGLEVDDEEHAILAEKSMKSIDSGSEQFVQRIFRPWLYWNFLLPYFRSGRKYLRMIHESDRLVRQIISELVKADTHKGEQNDSHPVKSCGNILMSLYSHHISFTKKDVRDHLVSFASAGYETVSVTMLWCLYTLGHHPQVQEVAYNEVQSIVPEGDVTYRDLGKLKYLECVIKETLRLYSTIPVITRKASKDIQCGRYTIPKGAEVGFFIFLLHRDPNVFPEPEKFKPERFADCSRLRPWMYIPFSEGYRNCIGKRFAMMEMKVQLTQVLRRFRITSLNKIKDSELDWTIFLNPTKPLRFLFENRHS